MKKIALLNFYGKQNIGDEAINQMALNVLRKSFKNNHEIYSISVDIKQNFYGIKSFQTISPYGAAMNQYGLKLNSTQKILKFINVVVPSIFIALCGLISKEFLPKHGTYAFIRYISEVDIVISMGGGYIRTKNKYLDYFGLITTLLPIWVAKMYSKKNIFLPMSFGKFASKSHENIAFNAIKNSVFFSRDMISYSKIKDNSHFESSNIRLLYSPDLALFNSVKSKMSFSEKNRNKYVILTAREWLDTRGQHKYEKSLAEIVAYLYTQYSIETKFISMASNEIEDNDRVIFDKVSSILNTPAYFTESKVSSPEEVLELLDNAILSICTRMHSAILSSLVDTPFLTLQYEHKTRGFMDSLSLSDLNIKLEEISFNKMKTLIDKILTDMKYRKSIIEKLQSSRRDYSSYQQLLINEIRSNA